MRKIILFLFILIFLSACNHTYKDNSHENRFDNNPNLTSDLEMYNEYMDRDLKSCFELCHTTIQETCLEEIMELEMEFNEVDGTIYDPSYCEGICESKWSDDVRDCIGKTKKCDTISEREPFCELEEDDSVFDYETEKEINYDCSSACYKYKICALRAADATSQDGNDAYNTCFEECQKWSKDTLNCFKKVDTSSQMGCANLSMCGLKEYNKYLK